MISSVLLFVSVALIFLLLSEKSHGFSIPILGTKQSTTSTTHSQAFFRLYYKEEAHPDVDHNGATFVETKQHIKKKASIIDLTTLEEIKSFVEDDDRLATIMFYAPFCKSCQKLKLHYEKLAVDMADGIVARKKVKGEIRCGRVEFNPQTKDLIMRQLRIGKVPTMQLYHGINKVWDVCGQNNTKELRERLAELKELTPSELLDYSEEKDDGVFLNALEEDLYEVPDFLNEEW